MYLDHSIQCKIDNQVISWRFLGSAALFFSQQIRQPWDCVRGILKLILKSTNWNSLFSIFKTYVNEYQAFSIISSSWWQAITALPGGFCTENRKLVYALNFSQPKSWYIKIPMRTYFKNLLHLKKSSISVALPVISCLHFGQMQGLKPLLEETFL